MLKNIRQSIFETNSSSMHTIVVTKEHRKYTPEEIDRSFHFFNEKDYKYVCIYNENDITYERYPFRILDNFLEKTLYYIAMLSMQNDMGKPDLEEVYGIIRKYLPGFEGFRFPKNFYTDKTFYGYIDHQSADTLSEFLKSNKVSLEDFLTDTRYIIFIDGDEYRYVKTLLELNLLDKQNIEQIFDCYETIKFGSEENV